MKEELRVKKVGLEEGGKETGNLVVQTLLDTEGLLSWYQQLPEAGKKAFLSVWRGGKFGMRENSTGDFKIGHYLLEHRNEESALNVANAYAQDPYGTVDALESALLWSGETEDMTAVAFENSTLLAGGGTLDTGTEPEFGGKTIRWKVDIGEPGEYSLDLHGMNKWDLRSALVFANGRTMQMNRWNQGMDFISFESRGNYEIEVRGIGVPSTSHASSGVIALRKVDHTVLGPHLGESTYKNSFTAGVKYPLPGEAFERQVVFGERMEVVRELVNIERFGGGEIQANVPTWIVIPGRESYASASNAIKGTANENNMYRLAGSLESFEAQTKNNPEDRFQILVADWRSFAGANLPIIPIIGDAADEIADLSFGLHGANYIQDVALALHEKLPSLAASQINFIVHSWGTLVGHDLAKNVMENTGQKVNSFVSLDTAGNSRLLGSNYPINLVDFRNVAKTSWAFDGSIFGSDRRSAKANVTAHLDFPVMSSLNAHAQVVEVFTDIIKDQTEDTNAPVARHFQLNTLLSGDLDHFPWREDSWSSGLSDQFETRISTFWNGKEDMKGNKLYEALNIDYVDKATGEIRYDQP